MPQGGRSSLAALILLLGVGGAAAEPGAGTTWTDPPARKPAAEAPAADRKAAAPAPVTTTPAAATEAAQHGPAKHGSAKRGPAPRKVAARRAPARTAEHPPAAKRIATADRTVRAAVAPPRAVRGPQVAVAAPPEGYARYRPYGYGPGSADERLDRLSSAEAAGYVVVRRRTVLFPDGRALRVYRPDDGEPF